MLWNDPNQSYHPAPCLQLQCFGMREQLVERKQATAFPQDNTKTPVIVCCSDGLCIVHGLYQLQTFHHCLYLQCSTDLQTSLSFTNRGVCRQSLTAYTKRPCLGDRGDLIRREAHGPSMSWEAAAERQTSNQMYF